MVFLYDKKKSGKGMPLREDAVHCHSGVGVLSFRRRPESRDPDLRQDDGGSVRMTNLQRIVIPA